MIKNELSIRASETERLSTNLANNKLRTIHLNISKNISKIKELVSFNSKKNEDRIFEEILNSLNENVSLLKEDNPYKAELSYYKNYRKEDLLAWSFVEIDRQNPDQQAVKAKIAHHRYKLVQIDNAIEQAKFDIKAFDIRFNDKIEYLLKYDELKQKTYHETDARLEEVSFNDFYNDLNRRYQKTKNAFEKVFPSFYKEIIEIIKQCYETATRGADKDNALLVARDIIASYNDLLELNKQVLQLEVEIAILREQKKEKFSVDQDIEDDEKLQKELNSKIKALELKINEKTKVLSSMVTDIKRPVYIELNPSSDVYDDKQIELIHNIERAFMCVSDSLSRELFDSIRRYYYANVQNYRRFFESEYSNYLAKVKDYRTFVMASMSTDLAKIYQDEEKYIAYISKLDDETIDANVKEVNATYDAKVQEAHDWYKEQVRILKENKEKRIAEYKKQKANAAIALKVADAQKASDLKEVVNLYKKEINQGEAERYAELRKALQEKVNDINSLRRIALAHVKSPEALSYLYEHKVAANRQNTQLKNEESKLKAHLRKELSISRYRKDMNVEKRELLLGYFFLAIWGIGFLIFTLVPIIYTVLMCFSDISYTAIDGYSKVIDFSFSKGITFPSWTGSENFEALFLSDVNFIYRYIPSFFRNLLLYVPIVVFIAFVLALLLNTKIKGRTLFRIIYFLPVVIVSGPVLTMLNNTDNNKTSNITITLTGSVVTILQSLSPKLLEYANEVFSNFIIILWMTGVPIVLFISGLQKIDKSLYEAADIDGANAWQKLWTITFPLIKSIVLIVCLFTIMQVTTINLPSVSVINQWITSRIDNQDYAIAALGAWVQTIIVLLFVLAAFLLFREKEFVVKQKSFEEMEAYKKKKALRRAKVASFFHLAEISGFIAKIFSPLTKLVNVTKEKIRIRKEERSGR